MKLRDVPNGCRRMLAAYKALGYAPVRSDRKGLIKLQYNLANKPPKGFVPNAQVVYIVANERSPCLGMALLNRGDG